MKRGKHCVFVLPLLILLFSGLKIPKQYELWLSDINKPQQDIRIGPGENGWNDLKDSLPDGKYIVYWDSSKAVVRLKGAFQKQKRIGKWIYFHENGQEEFSVNYVNGKREGSWVRYSYSGDTDAVGHFSKGKLSGTELRWDNNSWFSLPPAINQKAGPVVICEYRNNVRLFKNLNSAGQVYYFQYDSLPFQVTKTYTDYGEPEEERYRFPYPKEDSIVRYEGISPDRIYYLRINLQNQQGWNKLDSIQFFKNLHRLTIDYDGKAKGYSKQESDSLLNEKLKSLQSLNHFDDLILGSFIPPSVYELKTLKSFTFSCADSVDPRIGNMTGLLSLRIHGICYDKSKIAPEFNLPLQIKSLQNLRSLHLQNCRMRDPELCFSRLKDLNELQRLTISNCGLDHFPITISELSNLHVLNLAGSHDSKCGNHFIAFPESFYRMKNLRRMILPDDFYADSLQVKIKVMRKKMPLCVFELWPVCFPGNVHVTMSDLSSKRIDAVCTGERILCYNLQTEKMDTTTVLGTSVHIQPEQEILSIGFANGNTIRITPNHPVYVGHDKFIPAGELNKDAQAYSFVPGNLSNELKIESIISSTETLIPVYNLHTSKGTYFANGILVHNK